ncbi:MAG TPA: glycosyltransferase family 4 protein [Stellaceae bacterium]|nr:glycosyltransferase family 4 protein [Stellaceae bacterium]
MRIAFYAPLKPPDHPVPSGDRRVAQLFLAALRQAGHEPILAARLRSYDGTGDARRQGRLARLGARLAGRFVARCRRRPNEAPQLWFTYHLYHKAPDWLGPQVADRLGIPYLVAEASHAAKREGGAWTLGCRAAAAAIRRADAVIGLNPADREGVVPLLRDPARWVAMKPFIDAAEYSAPLHRSGVPARLAVVAMMRPGDKLASYCLLGEALRRLLDLPWSLEVIGDGPARQAVEEALAPLAGRVLWTGALAGPAVAARLAAADLYLWPAINEAFSMAFLEAQASGLPVVAGDAGGVRSIVAAGHTGLVVPAGDAAAFAAAVRALLLDPERRARLGEAARRHVLAEHDLGAAACRLAAVIDGIAKARAA